MDKVKKKYRELILNGKISDAIELIQRCTYDMPMFKYTPGRRYELATMFKTEGPQFYLSNLTNFNDPFDGLYLINCRTKKQYDKNNPEDVQKAYKEYSEQYEANKRAEFIQNRLYATCFSENLPQEIKMWSYYADNHRGLCSEYSLRELNKTNDSKKILFLPVVYTDKVPMLDIDNPDYLIQLAVVKGSEWAWENEWRMIYVSPEGKEPKCGEFVTGIYPKKIYCGCNDRKHIEDNYALKNKIENLSNAKIDAKTVFLDGQAGITLEDVEIHCKKNKISLSLMAKDTNSYTLYERKYLV